MHAGIKELLEYHAIPYEMISPKVNFAWNGLRLAVDNKDRYIVHDIAHYILCPPERRIFPDFGLGDGPDSKDTAPRQISDRETRLEEERASLLGVLYEKALGLPWLHSMIEQNWIARDNMDVSNHYKLVGGSGEALDKLLADFRQQGYLSNPWLSKLKVRTDPLFRLWIRGKSAIIPENLGARS